jgi:hypothetical protein
MSGLISRDSGSDQVATFVEMENALSRQEIPLENLTPKQAQAMRRLREIVKLPPNWDSYGSPPPTRLAIETVMDLLTSADDRNLPQVRIVPVSGGGVQLEWRVPPRELHLEVAGDGAAQYLQIENNQPINEDEITLTNDQVRALLAWLNPLASERLAA